MYKFTRNVKNISHIITKTKNVSTWSPLATAFNTRPIQKINFTRETTVSILLIKQNINCTSILLAKFLFLNLFMYKFIILQGLFNLPELKTYEGFHLLKENVIWKTDELINEAISSNRQRKMVGLLLNIINIR